MAVVFAAGLALTGCKGAHDPNSTSKSDAAVDGSVNTSSQSAEEREKDAIKKRLDEERSPRAVYGGPPPPRDSAGRNPNCKCAPGDPLCNCY